VVVSEPQNVYDDPRFFAGYSKMERFGAGWERAMERPVFLGLLPAVAGRRVVDLGCGVGQLAKYLAEHGAASVVGVDVSEKMLEIARRDWAHPRVTHRREAMETVDFPAGSVDLVVSSLAFHYVADYAGLVARIARWLSSGGMLVFSTEHPIYTSRGERLGATEWYGREGVREHTWFVEGVRRYHRTFATLMNGLTDARLTVERVEEPLPDEAWLAAHPGQEEEVHRPMFLVVRARKR